jgi:3-deoxy-D-manno-octulosonic-acid transferase
MSAVIKPKSPLLSLYRAGTSLARPVAAFLLRRRAERGKEDPARLHERFGEPSKARPAGPLIWAHAASVGESVSILPLIRALLTERPDANVMVTTGTVTSAQLMSQRLPPRAFHQFVPVDFPAAVAGFLDHWRPDLALWVESELWPNMILETAARGVPLALISARMSDSSLRNWARAPGAAKALLGSFQLILPQDEATGARLRALGGAQAGPPSNLKLWAEPLPVDTAVLASLQAQVSGRPVWLAASTHEGEEALAGRFHRALWARIPSLLTLIAPRHPNRGPAIAAELRREGFVVAQRSAGEPVSASTEIYLADTLGEMGLLYRTAKVVLIGKTLIGEGGQNPLEPARLGCAIVSGPNIGNFEPVFDLLIRAKAAEVLANEGQVQDALARLLTDKLAAEAMGARAERLAGDPAPLENTLAALRPLLKAMPHDARA